METKTYVVYNYDELSPEAKKKAIEWAQEFLREDNFYFEDVQDTWREKLEKFGFTDVKISFSGFWSQGDGASFTANCDILKFIEATKQKKYYSKLLYQVKKNNLDMYGSSINISRHYCHENTVKGQIDFEYHDDRNLELSKLENELTDCLTDFIRTESKKIYRELESAYYAYTNEESAIDCIQANEYTFLESGKRSDQIIGRKLTG